MKLFIKLLISAGLIGLIIWYMGGIAELVTIVKGANPAFFILAFFIITFDRALMMYKWKLLLKSRNQQIPFFHGLKIYCSAMIWGLFLPTTVGADAIRAYITTKSGLNGHEVIASIVVERMVGFIASLIMGLIGLYILSSSAQFDDKFDSIWYAGSIVLLAGIILFAISFSQSFFDIFYGSLPDRWHEIKIVSRLKGLHETYISYKANRRSVFLFFNLTLFEQLFTIVFGWVIALALNVDVDLIFIAGVMPVTILITRLPISFDGIGVFEGIFVILMALGGIGAAEAISIALVGRVVQILSWMPWWLTYTIQSGHARPPKIYQSEP